MDRSGFAVVIGSANIPMSPDSGNFSGARRRARSMAERFTNWRTALNDYVHSVMSKPFIWGTHDCALWAAGAVLAMTGYDPAEKYRGRYKTLIGGLRLLRKDGFEN